MERGHEPIRRGVSWTEGGAMTSDATISDRTSPHSWEKEKHGWVEAKPLLISTASRPPQKTNLGRSASLSEKELKEAQTRSQIIAAQLTVPSNPNSKGVQLFNRRRQRVNAFTLVSVAGGQEGGQQSSQNEPDSPSGALTWNRKCSTDSQFGDLEHCKNDTQTLQPSDATHDCGHNMDEAEDVKHKVENVPNNVQERHFLPVNEKDEEITEEQEEAGKDKITGGDDNFAVSVPNQAEQEELEPNGVYEGSKASPNICHSTGYNGKEGTPASKQSTITNRTARPFFSSAVVNSAGASNSTPDIPPAPSYSTPPLPVQYESHSSTYSELQLSTPMEPHVAVSSRRVFSPPPPAPLYPTPPLPTSVSLPSSVPTDPHPPTAMSPPPTPTYCASPAAPHLNCVPQLLTERRSETPIRTGLLDEGRVRRTSRKSMFTFQEKPKVSPNPDLLSLVRRTDDLRKGRSQAELHQEEEQMALGAEASNFQAKDDKDESTVEEVKVPVWASTLKCSYTQKKVEHKPEQALTHASGKGADLFAKRQSRMERYVHDSADRRRSPSPTMSLPPSWEYPSNMPGRVKAIINASNVSTEISKTLEAQHATQKRSFQAHVPAPVPVQENPVLENGCSRVEMELSRHQPYQISSSLFILNPTKDPLSTLPKGAPPPKPVLMKSAFSGQSSLPTQYNSSDAYRSAHCFSPPMMPLRSASSDITTSVSSLASERVISPRSGVQAPKPTFSAKKAGITPQVMKESPAAAPCNSSGTQMSRTSSLFRRLSSTDKPPSGVWSSQSPRSSLFTSPPPRSIHNPIISSPTPRPISHSVPSSPPPSRIQNSTSAPTSRPFAYSNISSSTSPSIQNFTCTSPTPKPFQNRVTSSPTSRSIQNSIRSSQRPFQSPGSTTISNHTATTPVSPPWESSCKSPSPQDTKANHRLLAKNIINAAKRKNSPSPGALSGHNFPISPVSNSFLPFETKTTSPFQSRSLSAQSPTFTSPPATPTRTVRSPLRLYTTRSLTDGSDASLESEDSGVRSPGLRSYNTCPRGWTGSLRLKRIGVSEDL
ncbi:synaptopodin [Trichomycterus rosablanca]|uniref:synaptopodin n=1 Tax=Trichomycterus rosablanca TaxID=2290929 RepID=UPI002F35565B